MATFSRWLWVGFVIIFVACQAPVSAPAPTVVAPAGSTVPSPSSAAPASPTVTPSGPTIVIDPSMARPFARQLLGANVPAWLNPYRLSDETFISRTADLGLTLLRMPGKLEQCLRMGRL